MHEHPSVRLVPGPNLWEILASTYTYCLQHFDEVQNEFRLNPDLVAESKALDEDLRAVLAASLSANPAILSCHDRLRFRLSSQFEEQQADWHPARAFALLKACSIYAADHIFQGQRLVIRTQARYFILPQYALPSRARTTETISDMVVPYHPGIDFVPVIQDNIHLNAARLRPEPARQLDHRIAAGFQVAIAPLSSTAKITGHSLPDFPAHQPARFLVDSVGDETMEAEQLEAILQSCYDAGAAAVVLPELRMPPALLSRLRAFLRRQVVTRTQGILLAAAGSWHIEREPGRHRNRCSVLDSRGETIWLHDKLREYHISADNVTKAPVLLTVLGINEYGAQEAIERGTDLTFYQAVGMRFSAAICVGFFHADVRPVIKATRANLFLVPAMSDKLDKLDHFALDLVEHHHAATCVANCGVAGAAHPDGASFVRLPSERDRQAIASKEAVHFVKIGVY